jgi:lipopolysaccharide biosynthesis regulator YciM
VYLDYVSLFWVIIAVLIAGVMLGRAWWYVSSREEKIFSSRLVRGSSSYLLGMNYLISNQPDLAIMELSRAAKQDPDAVEVQIVLGNLYREKGQAEKAIQIHKGVYERKSISPSEKNLARFCLGLDYKSAGFVDRSIEVFEELHTFDSNDDRVLTMLVKLYEEVGQLDKAYRTQQELIRLQRLDDYSTLALLEVQIGKNMMDKGEYESAEKRFKRAIDLEPKAYPAYLYYGDLLLMQEQPQEAAAMWEKLVESNSKRAHLVFRRLQRVYDDLGTCEKMEVILTGVMKKNKYDWRSRIFLSHYREKRGDFMASYDLLKEASRMNPHNLAIHQRVWKLFSKGKMNEEMMQDYLKLTEENIFFLDPFVCIECGYRTTEYLWKCPHCHSWESFVEVRM